jgi:hypothetical protein
VIGGIAIAQPARDNPSALRGVETTLVRSGAAPAGPTKLLIPQEKRGLVFKMQSINASSSISANPSCPCGYSVNRNLGISGNVMDMSGSRSFRIADLHITAVEDDRGRDMRTPGMFHAYPNPANTQQFTRPRGHQQSMSFSMNFNQLQSMPETISRLAGHVDVELAGKIKTIDIDPNDFGEPVEVAPGMSFQLTRYGFQGTNLQLAFEYRIDQESGPASAFYGFEILDTDGQQILDIQNTSRTVTTDSIIGTSSYNTGIGNREIASIRLRIATELETVRFDFDERDVPLLSAMSPAVAGAR